MGGIVDTIIYIITAPIRLFGRSRGFRIFIGAIFVVGLFFVASLWALDRFLPGENDAQQTVAKLKPLPPLQPLTKQSYVIAPVAIALRAIQRSLEASAPRTLTGKANNPISGLLQQADIGMTVMRGNIAVTGSHNEITAQTQLNGIAHITGSSPRKPAT